MGGLSRSIVDAFRRTAVPLVSYYAITLGVPIANGAATTRGAFLEHSVVVLLVPPFTIALVAAGREAARRLTSSP
jgi:hypothetical protein